MSASSKKKLRKAENAEILTEKQRTEQAEAKKLKIYSIVFAVVIGLMVVFAAWTMISNTIENSGVRERSTVAAVVGDHELNTAELNYFYIDAINNFYSSYGSYASMFGLDLTKPLDEQVIDEEGTTWADDFLSSALDSAAAVYALTDEAKVQGYTLSEDELAQIDSSMENITMYATLYGYTNAEDYIKAMYGNGATEESLREYYELTFLADSFYNNYCDSLDYTDADLRAAEAENYDLYSSFTYNYYYLGLSKFYEGGTTDEEGNTTYTDAEIEAAQLACKTAAEELAAGEYASVEEFDAAIAALSINAEATSASSNACKDYGYSSVNSLYVDWIADDSRTAGDVTFVENTTTSTDDAGNEETTVNGYYVVYYGSSTDNNFPLTNVRHILVSYEGGTTDETTGTTTYSDEEKAIAEKAAQALLAEWESGEATEESFAELANAESDDGDGTTGGLYEHIYPGQMVTNFNDWCFDEARQPGDTGIVGTEYGYHVMYYVGDSDMTYRDYQITNELVNAAANTWYTELFEAMESSLKDTKYISTDLVLSSAA